MGTSSSVPALGNNQAYKKGAKAWIGLKAAIRFQILTNGIWNTMRSEREPWRSILLNAASDFEDAQEELADTKELETTEHFRSMLLGTIPPKSLKHSGREVWVFISSTFTDTKLERDLLLTDVYPYVREYCRQIGLDYNVVDFRWGIRQGESNRHKATEICLREVQRCRENSTGPYFVAILGEKYGYRPVPPKLSMELYTRILDHLKREDTTESLEAVAVIEEWYRLDLNSVAPEYLLQPINSKLANYLSPNETEAARAREEWNQIFTIMQNAIFRAAGQCGLEAEVVSSLTQSVTESTTDFQI